MRYFTQRHRAPPPRHSTEIGPTLWKGIVAHIESLVASCAFAERYPELCQDGGGPVATNSEQFGAALQAEVPGLSWPLQTTARRTDGLGHEPYVPDTFLLLDMLEFCYAKVSKPARTTFHSFFNHHHLTFDAEAGRREFRDHVNTLFERNGVAYEMDPTGMVQRLVGPAFRKSLSSLEFATGDRTLDGLLREAHDKYLKPRAALRREAVERLWDAWERLKSLKDPNDKKRSVKALLDCAAADGAFRQVLEKDAEELTRIGNGFQIRHTEVGKVPLGDDLQIDYLFLRLWVMVSLLVRKL